MPDESTRDNIDIVMDKVFDRIKVERPELFPGQEPPQPPPTRIELIRAMKKHDIINILRNK